MGELSLRNTSELLRRANSAGIKLSVVREELIATIEGVLTNEPDLLQEIQEHKGDLIKYLNSYFKQLDENETLSFDLIRIRYEDQYYYAISSTQVYWVDPAFDREYKENNPIHGVRSLLIELTGEFNIDSLKDAVQYLVVRHESLRTTFHNIDGHFLLKVEEGFGKYFEHIVSESVEEVGRLLGFLDHSFDLSKGPLFIVRLFRKEENVYHIGIRIHHAIFDSLSEDILLGELLAVYQALSRNIEPELPMLKYQYKDYLSAMVNFSKAYLDEHRSYWLGLYKCLPAIIRLPEAREIGGKIEMKITGVERFSLCSELVEKLVAFCRRSTASLFVVIQAAFKFFVFKKTGACDIMIGTDVFGRNYPEMEAQIGCYATTEVIRTVFAAEDSFETAIRKVKKANEDMHNYRAFPLSKAMELLLPPGENLVGSYWKFNLLFRDLQTRAGINGGGNELTVDLNLKMAPQHETVDRVIAVDMIWKFLKAGEGIELDLLYDTSKYSGDSIRMVMSGFFEFLTGL